MFTRRNEYINNSEVLYVRHVKKIPPGYDRGYYPEYSLFMSNGMYFTVEESDLKINPFFKNSAKYCKIEDDTFDQPFITFGYPKESEITYYINLSKIIATSQEQGWLQVHFSGKFPLNIYKKEQREELMGALYIQG